ncbi:MAG TPA: hypothetical protein VFT63_01360 [bacterium]|nr:hypothetical protein [bacterium]
MDRALAKVQLGLVSIMRAASELNVLGCCFSARAERHDVMKLEKCPLRAATAIPTNECTLATVTLPHGSPDFGRNMT